MNKKGQAELIIVPIIIILIVGGLILGNWIASGHQAKLLNEKWGTHYTQSECFWAPKTILSFINGGEQKTQNINIKGAIPVQMIEE
jgi:hypothetical protein